MAVKYQPVVTESISKQIAEQIRDSIMDGRLQVNDRLPTEEELAVQFNVSRPTIREALKRLAAQHLIRSRRGPTGGTFVNRPSLTELSANLSSSTTLMVLLGEFGLTDIIEARHEMERLCARFAAERITDEQISEIKNELNVQLDENITDVEFCASDIRYHRTLANASGNPVLRFLMTAVIEALQPVENMIIFRFRERAAIIDQHKKLVTALEDRDSDAACLAIDSQMEYLRDRFAEAEKFRAENDR